MARLWRYMCRSGSGDALAGRIVLNLSELAEHLNQSGNENWYHTLRPVQESELSADELQQIGARREAMRARRARRE